MDTIEFNINDVQVKDLDGDVLPVNLPKVLGNMIYTSVPDVGWVSHAMNIHAEKPTEFTNEQAQELINIIDSPRCMLIIAAKIALKEYINNLLKQTRNGTEESK